MKESVTPQISIVVPAYNVENYIYKCLISIINQTYKNIEVIVIDDGSTDNTMKIASDVSMLNKNVHVYGIKNSGVSVARNIGIAKSKGEYIFFVDSDDFVDIDIIEKLFNKIYFEKSEFSICWVKYLTKENELISPQIPYKMLEYGGNPLNGYKLFIEAYTTGIANIGMGCVGKLYKKSIIVNNGIEFDNEVQYAEDVFFNIKYLHAIKSVSFVFEALYTGRDRPLRATKIYQPQKIKNLHSSINKFENLINENHFMTPLIHKNLIKRKIIFYLSSMESIVMQTNITFAKKIAVLNSMYKDYSIISFSKANTKRWKINYSQKKYRMMLAVFHLHNKFMISTIIILAFWFERQIKKFRK